MVQINLPKDSEVTKGKYYQDKTGSKNIRKVNVYRWDPSTEENPLHTFEELGIYEVILTVVGPINTETAVRNKKSVRQGSGGSIVE